MHSTSRGKVYECANSSSTTSTRKLVLWRAAVHAMHTQTLATWLMTPQGKQKGSTTCATVAHMRLHQDDTGATPFLCMSGSCHLSTLVEVHNAHSQTRLHAGGSGRGPTLWFSRRVANIPR